ncbi:MAG: hypothetical protein U1F68_18430 [Gammaproteobacteria bacterium]
MGGHSGRRHRGRDPGQLCQDLPIAALPEVWLFALGTLFVLVTLLLPRGLAGLWRGLR